MLPGMRKEIENQGQSVVQRDPSKRQRNQKNFGHLTWLERQTKAQRMSFLSERGGVKTSLMVFLFRHCRTLKPHKEESKKSLESH